MSQRRDPESYATLLREMTRSIVELTGAREDIARQFADAAMVCLQDRKAANGLIYVGTPPRQHDVLQIRAALERGESVGAVCRAHCIGRTKLFELFPGGLPEPQNGTASGVSKKVRTHRYGHR